MDRSELGKRIREARLAKKMTQTEVVGSFITRNMLSQIESGSAYPSLKTLEYLAGVLDIPMQILLPDGKEPDMSSPENSLEKLIRAKRLLADKKYALAAEAADEFSDGELYDESCAIAARCYINMANAAEKDGDLRKAAELAEKADAFADEGAYSSREIKTSAALLLDRIAEKLGK